MHAGKTKKLSLFVLIGFLLAVGNRPQMLIAAGDSDKPRDAIALTLWVIGISDQAEDGENQVKPAAGATGNMPVVFKSFENVRKSIEDLRSAGLVRSTREFRFTTVDGGEVTVNRGAKQPRITATSTTESGQTNAVSYESIGTHIRLFARHDREKRIYVKLDYNDNDFEKSDDIVISQPKDGTPQYADVSVSHEFTIDVMLNSGTAVVLQSDVKSASTESVSSAGGREMIVLGAELLPASE